MTARTVTITLRPGLRFHDGEPVLARDAVASLRRWMVRSVAFGDKLGETLDELSAVDDRRLRFRMKRPFPVLLEALGSPVGPIAFMMPERMAKTDPFVPVKEMVGSGPYRFKTDEYRAGAGAAYERFAGYVPRQDGHAVPDRGAENCQFRSCGNGPRWILPPRRRRCAPGRSTGSSRFPPELETLLAKQPNIRIEFMDDHAFVTTFRPNRSQPPFNDKRILQCSAAGHQPVRLHAGRDRHGPGAFRRRLRRVHAGFAVRQRRRVGAVAGGAEPGQGACDVEGGGL